MTFPHWVERIANEVSQEIVDGLLGKEFVVYREEFEGPSLDPSADYFVKGPLELGDSGNAAQGVTISPAPGSVPQPSNGLVLGIDGPQPADPVSVSLSISRFPTRLQLLRVLGAFRTVPSIPPAHGPWAAAVFVSQEGAADGPDLTRRVSATMRVNNGTAVLGTPGSTPLPASVQSPNRFQSLYPPGSAGGVDFTIELLLDLAGGSYFAYLDTPGNRDTRQFDHGALPSLWPRTSIGLGLARAAAIGHAAIEVRAFEVSAILVPGFWDGPFAGLLKAARRAVLPRFVPPKPLR